MGGLVPIGYDADGRTLSINDAEAKTVRTLYDLYEQHQRAFKPNAAPLPTERKAAACPSRVATFIRS